MWDEGVGDIIKRRGAWPDENAAALIHPQVRASA
jgi:hypothetical protein